MKTRNLLIATFIAALALTACEKNDDTTKNLDIVQINGYVTPGNLSRANINEYDGKGNFENGDIWGMYATIDGNQELNNSEYIIGSTALYWKNLSTTGPVTFTAHYPRITGAIADPEAYMFNVAEATNPDLLMATPVTKSKGEDVNLNFKHVMHQLVIDLGKHQGVPGSLGDTEITLLNMKSSIKVNLLTGAVDTSSASGTDSYSMKKGGGIWFVAPQSLTPGADWIQLELAGYTYKYKVPANLAQLESERRISLNLTLKLGGEVELTEAISEWIPQRTTVYGDAIAD